MFARVFFFFFFFFAGSVHKVVKRGRWLEATEKLLLVFLMG